MRLKEIIQEQLISRNSAPMVGMKEFPSMPGNDSYQAYRFGLLMANHQARAEGPTDQFTVILARNKEEENIIAQAERASGHKGRKVSTTDSHETQDVNKTSLLTTAKRNRFGV
jgi:hypothetical protein